jgi:hypothetical protein
MCHVLPLADGSRVPEDEGMSERSERVIKTGIMPLPSYSWFLTEVSV